MATSALQLINQSISIYPLHRLAALRYRLTPMARSRHLVNPVIGDAT